MTRMKIMIAAGAAVALLGAPAFAQELKGHPHLKAAHNRIENALKDLAAANDGKVEFGGHREKAEELLKQALQEIVAAADFANAHGKK